MASAAAEEASLTVRVEAGAVRGRVAEAASLDCARRLRYRSFQGIPYARPPVGELRFKPPEPVQPWEGVRDACSEGAECAQLDFWERHYKGDEDCLYLNVYTPLVESAAGAGRWPTMVWVHGGGFAHSSGTAREYGPDYLLAHDVVLVTFNYRLGPLGFLTTGDALCPGNMGLRDVLAALRWVRRNVAAFGGDPDNVTIFGESAGSITCHGLLLSPVADGLFHKVICQSGVTFAAALSSPVAERSWRLARHLGLPAGASSQQMLDFLRRQPVRALVENQLAARSQQEEETVEQFPFVPVLESAGSPGALFTSEPADLLRAGSFTQRPLMLGFNSREGLLFHKDIVQNKSAIPELNKNFHKLIPSNVPMKEPLRVFVGKKIKKFYFGSQPFDESTIGTYCDCRCAGPRRHAVPVPLCGGRPAARPAARRGAPLPLPLRRRRPPQQVQAPLPGTRLLRSQPRGRRAVPVHRRLLPRRGAAAGLAGGHHHQAHDAALDQLRQDGEPDARRRRPCAGGSDVAGQLGRPAALPGHRRGRQQRGRRQPARGLPAARLPAARCILGQPGRQPRRAQGGRVRRLLPRRTGAPRAQEGLVLNTCTLTRASEGFSVYKEIRQWHHIMRSQIPHAKIAKSCVIMVQVMLWLHQSPV